MIASIACLKDSGNDPYASINRANTLWPYLCPLDLS